MGEDADQGILSQLVISASGGAMKQEVDGFPLHDLFKAFKEDIVNSELHEFLKNCLGAQVASQEVI